MAVQTAIARLQRGGWKVTEHGPASRRARGDGRASWAVAWACPWADDRDVQVHIEVNCRGTPEAALSRLLHLAEVIASDEASGRSASRELEEVAALSSGREVSLAAAVGTRTDPSQ